MTRKELKQELQAQGRWEPFKTLRARLVADGLTPREARREALRQLDASPVPTPPVATVPGDGSPNAGPFKPASLKEPPTPAFQPKQTCSNPRCLRIGICTC